MGYLMRGVIAWYQCLCGYLIHCLCVCPNQCLGCWMGLSGLISDWLYAQSLLVCVHIVSAFSAGVREHEDGRENAKDETQVAD